MKPCTDAAADNPLQNECTAGNPRKSGKTNIDFVKFCKMRRCNRAVQYQLPAKTTDDGLATAEIRPGVCADCPEDDRQIADRSTRKNALNRRAFVVNSVTLQQSIQLATMDPKNSRGTGLIPILLPQNVHDMGFFEIFEPRGH